MSRPFGEAALSPFRLVGRAPRARRYGTAVNGKALDSPLLCAKPFCRVRPVRTPKLVECRVTGNAHRKNAPATAKGRERFTRITTLSPRNRSAIGRERQVIIAHLSHPTPVTAPFLEALSQVRKHCPAFGAHTGYALQNCFAKSQCPSTRFAIYHRRRVNIPASRTRPRLSRPPLPLACVTDSHSGWPRGGSP